MYKSQLSIYWQKNTSSVNQPKYSHREVSPQQFIGCVNFLDRDFCTTETYPNTKDATNEAARLALDYINSNCQNKNGEGSEEKEKDCKLILLIDLDNQMNGLKIIPRDGSVRVIGVGGPRIIIPPEYKCSYFVLWKTKRTTKDAADIELIWHISKIYKSISKDMPIRIASGDYTLVNLSEILIQEGYNCSWSPSVKDILDNLKL